MSPKTNTPSPSENSGDLPSQKPSNELPEKTGKKEAVRRGQWLDGSMIGKKFGSLTVIDKGVRPGLRGATMVRCRCDCGDEKLYITANLGRTLSCRKCGLERGASKIRTHGRQPRDVFRIWGLMRNRCLNKKGEAYVNYGARGIGICERWDSFENFRDDMGPRPSPKHSVERLDNSKDYSPENCKWATMSEQCRNRRSSKLITAFGQTKTVAEWAETAPVNYSTLNQRLVAGWDAEKALTEPKHEYNKH
jgi:hypothetical protein